VRREAGEAAAPPTEVGNPFGRLRAGLRYQERPTAWAGGTLLPYEKRRTAWAGDTPPEAAKAPCPTGDLPCEDSTPDVYLNDVAYWRNVPEKVWGYTIGGYQVMKKWLSYREEKLLGRSLSMEESREVTDMARRIAAILLLAPALRETADGLGGVR